MLLQVPGMRALRGGGSILLQRTEDGARTDTRVKSHDSMPIIVPGR